MSDEIDNLTMEVARLRQENESLRQRLGKFIAREASFIQSGTIEAGHD